VREAEKVKRLRFPLAPSLTSFDRKAAKLDEPGLLGVQFQVESMKPLPKLNPKSLSLVLMLKADDEVIAVADDDDIPARVTTPPLLSPEVKDVVEVDVREQRAHAPSLGSPFLLTSPLPILEYTGVQPLPDVTHHAPVPDPMLDEFH